VKRREFITLLGGATTWTFAARAQQPAKLPTIGYLGSGTPATQTAWLTAFLQRLREMGWAEGQNIKIELGWGEARSERLAELAAKFSALHVDVIVTTGGGVPEAKRATSSIPIVFAGANDPLGSGYVASLARPGGNVTGVSLQSTDLVGKRLDLLHEVLPNLARLALIGPTGNPSVRTEMEEAKAIARGLGIEVTTFEIERAQHIAPAFEALKNKVDAVYVVSSPFTTASRVRINTLALVLHLPTIYGYRDSVEIGGLMSYGPDFLSLWRRAAEYVDKILRGAKPADLPVEQPTKFDLVINLTTARALGLNIPDRLLALADEVIE
jgi:putative tryptophan/tyrosine transport system substrate-binding protein